MKQAPPLLTISAYPPRCVPRQKTEYLKGISYSSAVGSLMYTIVCSRPDIAHAVGVVSRYTSNPSKTLWQVVKWILIYLKGTSNYVLCFGGKDAQLQGIVDSDMAGDLDK